MKLFDGQKLAISIINGLGSTRSLIIHTIGFISFFLLYLFGVPSDKILLLLTTIVSLEAIYLSIFIQMSVNIQSKQLKSVAEEVGEIQENVEDLQENVEEIQENIEEINETEDDDEEDYEKLKKTINDLKKEVNDLKKRKK